ncbi:hypothetical protein ACFPRL_28580 [Pseudoclavibacter helvolus]
MRRASSCFAMRFTREKMRSGSTSRSGRSRDQSRTIVSTVSTGCAACGDGVPGLNSTAAREKSRW